MSQEIFALAQFQVKAAALSPGTAGALDDAYVFAWSEDLFPLFHERTGLHGKLANYFRVNEAALIDLYSFLDKLWLADELVTFYKLERTVGRDLDAAWTRSDLIAALRYAHLSRRFDPSFFAKLLTAGEHPVEATLINSDYDRLLEISLV